MKKNDAFKGRGREDTTAERVTDSTITDEGKRGKRNPRVTRSQVLHLTDEAPQARLEPQGQNGTKIIQIMRLTFSYVLSEEVETQS